jgi:hypothetical protein
VDLVKNESDEEREQRKARRAAGRKVKSEATSGDEGLSTPGAVGGGGGGEPKKKRRKLKKGGGVASAGASTQASDAEDGGALFSEGEEEKPIKKVCRLYFFYFVLGLMVWVTISVGRRGNGLRAKRTRKRRLHPAKNNSKCSLLFLGGSDSSC